MEKHFIKKVYTKDRRYTLENGAGSDAVHNTAMYAMACCHIQTESGITGTGYVLTLGLGNDIVCETAKQLAQFLQGKEINELMANFSKFWEELSDDAAYRWLGPHKGVVHLALAAVSNACFDLWAKVNKKPLWKQLSDLSVDQIMNLLNFRYVEDFLSRDEARSILEKAAATVDERKSIIKDGFPAYDTSVGWFGYSDELIKENTKKAVENGFKAMKLKVGSKDPERDIRRAMLVRQTAGDEVTIMLDANQQWTLQQALTIIPRLKAMNPFWIEEPTDPDDVLAHQTLKRALNPINIALGEHVPNKVMFKNYLQSGAVGICQVDSVRVGGISEFILISLMAQKCGVPVIPHVGDMGHIHQHMLIFNHLAIGQPVSFLEYIPHLEPYFKSKIKVENGNYCTPTEPGSSSDFLD